MSDTFLHYCNRCSGPVELLKGFWLQGCSELPPSFWPKDQVFCSLTCMMAGIERIFDDDEVASEEHAIALAFWRGVCAERAFEADLEAESMRANPDCLGVVRAILEMAVQHRRWAEEAT